MKYFQGRANIEKLGETDKMVARSLLEKLKITSKLLQVKTDKIGKLVKIFEFFRKKFQVLIKYVIQQQIL